tara:strand:+ start:786 stop:1175 length:390 start_codon:yes stop_codon:yes gene_type:complete
MDIKKKELKMITLKRLENTTDFSHMAVSDEIPNRLILVRTLKRTGLVQVYISTKTHSNIKDIFDNGQFSWVFNKYRGQMDIKPAFDTAKYTTSKKRHTAGSFKGFFKNDYKNYYEVCKKIQSKVIQELG